MADDLSGKRDEPMSEQMHCKDHKDREAIGQLYGVWMCRECVVEEVSSQSPEPTQARDARAEAPATMDGEKDETHLLTGRMNGSMADYHNAPSGVGPLADEWADKPHRLLYDLLGEIRAMRERDLRAEHVIEKLEQAQQDAKECGMGEDLDILYRAVDKALALLRQEGR